MILHIDMDAFYASVEEREQPALRGKPLVVGGRADARGVVSTANYAARKFGIHSAMPTATAIKLCPQLRVIAPRGELYSQVAAQIRAIFGRYTPVIEPLSLDEAFLDPSGSERLHGDAVQIGKAVRDDIARELKLVASVGIAPNKFLAKLASGADKPHGFTVIQPHAVRAFLDELPVVRIWGVGKVAAARLHRKGIHSVAQLRQCPPDELTKLFGQNGERLLQLAHGIDSRKVIPDSEVKSISQETTFAVDIEDINILQSCALDLTESVGFRLRRAGLCGKTITVKIRFDDFSTITRSRSRQATDSTADLWHIADNLLRNELAGKKFSVRLIGVGVSNFGGDASQRDLFESESAKQKALDKLTDRIKQRYGKATIRRGKAIQS